MWYISAATKDVSSFLPLAQLLVVILQAEPEGNTSGRQEPKTLNKHNRKKTAVQTILNFPSTPSSTTGNSDAQQNHSARTIYTTPCLVPKFNTQIPLCKKEIFHHIKMPANAWSTKCR
jgi:hypothetical protein